MTDVKVVDASALIAVLFGEPAGKQMADLLAGARLIAPTLLASSWRTTAPRDAGGSPTRERR